jgi:Uma2 family endonuclease
MVTTTKFTRADYMRLPEGYPAELIDGMLVKTPSPSYGHQRMVGDLLVSLHGLVGRDRVVASPIDVFLDEHNTLQPDVAVFRDAQRIDTPEVDIPLIVVEVLSPSTANRDRRVKREIYLRAGVEEVWIVDPVAETIEIYRPTGSERFTADEAAASRCVPGFSLTARALLS